MGQHTVGRLMEKHGVPDRGVYELPESSLRFPDGAQYRVSMFNPIGRLAKLFLEL